MKSITDVVSLLKSYIDAHAGTVTSQTLAANATQVTFTGIPTTGDHIVDFYITDGSNYKDIDISTAGTAVLTYEASASARTVFCSVKEV